MLTSHLLVFCDNKTFGIKKEQYSPEVMSDKRQMPGNKEVDNRSREIIKTTMGV